jgi:hypothetical protein
MRAKRLDIRAIFVATLFSAVVPVAAQAQLVNGEWRLPASGGGTRAVQPATPQPQVIVVPGQRYYPQTTVFPRRVAAYTLVPAILMADGSVLADFGFGYEPVYRSCSGTLVTGQPTIVGGNGVVLNAPQAPTYTQPVPNQQTASQQMLSTRTNTVYGSTHSQTSCYNRDPGGRVIVVRF